MLGMHLRSYSNRLCRSSALQKSDCSLSPSHFQPSLDTQSTMKFPSTLCILSLGLSLIVLADAHQQQGKQDYDSNKIQAYAKPKNHHHHQDAHHNAPEAIPNVPYQGYEDKSKEKQTPLVVPKENTPSAPSAPSTSDPLTTEKGKDRDDVAQPTVQKEKMVVAYWTDWTAGTMPPEAIPFDKVTHVNYAFSVVTPEFKPVFETDQLLKRVVKSAHSKNVKVLMSIGGWTGSAYFSPLATSWHGRKTFIDGAIDIIRQNDLDGIDIDWEYPGRLGGACNKFDQQNDANNFLTLLRELRDEMNLLPDGEKLQISLATRIVPFDGPDGPMKDVSEFSKVVNHINVMAYDINGSWGSVTGANAPLEGAGLTYVAGAEAWIQAGFPPEQINMGLPFYGRSLITKKDMTFSQSMAAPFDKKVPIGDNNDALWTDPCEKTPAYSGVWKYRNLRGQGLIDANDFAIAPWVRKVDEESRTPWLFNPETKQFISYDDRQSLKLKVDFAKQKNLGGVMLWAINQDTEDFALLNVLQEVRA